MFSWCGWQCSQVKKKITETTERTICNISTANNIQEISELLDIVNIPTDLRSEITDLLKNAMYSQTKLDNDLDIVNTTLRKIQNILCIPR
jgi:3-deoxy-D-manno-octulosonic acid (KDO) 8-phosphate synthase